MKKLLKEDVHDEVDADLEEHGVINRSVNKEERNEERKVLEKEHINNRARLILNEKVKEGGLQILTGNKEQRYEGDILKESPTDDESSDNLSPR